LNSTNRILDVGALKYETNGI